MEFHKPVLIREVLNNLPKRLEKGLDGTLGHGGHTEAILKAQSQIKEWIGIDRDIKILDKAKSRLLLFQNKIKFVHDSYSNLDRILKKEKVDFMLLDLGVNMEHFKDFSRGFSIKGNGELDMRFDTTSGKPLWQLIKYRGYKKLFEGLVDFGDFGDKFSEWLASEILEQRKKHPIKNTLEFKYFLRNLGLGEKKIAVVFQVLRIMVNDELEELKKFLDVFPEFLNSGGRVAIISYHSGEDRLVKNVFKSLEKYGEFKILTKKIIKPSWQEISSNRAARSAKMRIIEKI